MKDVPVALPERSLFDFGLNVEEEMRAAALHAESIVFDMLSMNAGSAIFHRYPQALLRDLQIRVGQASNRTTALSEAIYWPFEMALESKSDLIHQWLRTSGLTCGVYNVEDNIIGTADPLRENWDARLRRFEQLPWLRFVTTSDEIRQAKSDGAIAMYANFQPTVPIGRDLTSIDDAYRRGLRSLMLTYNRMDHVGVGCTERVDAGLSSHGLDVVERCNKNGIVVDLSHCGRLTTLDACKHSARPVTANHTSCKSIFDHARGKSDEEIFAIARTGGLIGVVAVPHFLTGERAATIEHMLDHIDHIAVLVGTRHVALGTDWPWPLPDEIRTTLLGEDYDRAVGFRPSDNIDRSRRLIGFEDCLDLVNITRGLVSRSYSDDQIREILGLNALRVLNDA